MDDKLSPEDIYNGILKNKDTNNCLQHFVQQAEEFNAKISEVDVVRSYLQLSKNGEEILLLIRELSVQGSTLSAPLFLNALCHIIIRIASDLDTFLTTGTALANEVLSHGMRTIYNFLKLKQKSSRTKVALHLLTAMIALGKQTAALVVTKLNFSDPNFVRLLNRANIAEREDVRMVFLNMVVLIFSTLGNNAIRQIVEVKGFLNQIFPGLLSDRSMTVTLVLESFQQYIVENPSIPKTTKVKVFNDHSLRSVIQLYSWKGPVKTKTHRKRKLGDNDQLVDFEVDPEEATEVQLCAHQFMLALCCNSKTGIVFSSPFETTHERNNNQIITNILKSFRQPYSNALMTEFVVSVLKACPEQLKFYLPTMKESFIPRLSNSWINAVEFLKKILQSQDVISVLFKTPTKKPLVALWNMTENSCLLNVFSESDIIQSFMAGHTILCHYLCSFLISVLSGVKSIVNFCDHPDTSVPYDSSELLAFQQLLLNCVLKNAFLSEALQTYWNKLTSGSSEIDVMTLQDLPNPDLPDKLLTVVEVIKLYQYFAVKSKKVFDFNLTQAFSSLKSCNQLINEDVKRIFINIVDLITEQSSSAFWNKEKNFSPLMVVLDGYKAARKAKNFQSENNMIYKILLHSRVFEAFPWEIDVWIEAMQNSKTKHIPLIFDFINDSMFSVFENNKLTVLGQKCDDEEKMEISFALENEMDESGIESSASSNDHSSKKCCSDFTLCALRLLSSLDDENKKACSLFVERALENIMLYQHSPKAFFAVLKAFKTCLSAETYIYLKLLSSPKKEIKDQFDGTAQHSDELNSYEHLKRNFLSNHSSIVSSLPLLPEKLKCLIENSDISSKRKVLLQVLVYLDYEIKLVMKMKTVSFNVLNDYIHLLEVLIECLELNESASNSTMDNSHESTLGKNVEVFADFLNHSVVHNLFLNIPSAWKSQSNTLQSSCVSMTNLTVNVLQKLSKHMNNHICSIAPLKEKLLTVVQCDIEELYKEIDLFSVLELFCPLLGVNEVRELLQKFLTLDYECKQFEMYVASLCLLLQTLLDRNECANLSEESVNSLFLKFISMPKKQKKVLRQLLIQLFKLYPNYALQLTEDCNQLFLQYKTVKDFPLIALLIDGSEKFRRSVQINLTQTFEDMEKVEFVYLVSKCVLNCTESSEDETFEESVSSKFFEYLREILFEDITAECDILTECNAGKATKALLSKKHKKSSKKCLHVCKSFLELDSITVPSLSKMHVLIDVFESWKLFDPEKVKTKFPILSKCFSWLLSGLNEEFKYWKLMHFVKDVLENMNDVNISDNIDVNKFFTKSLKIALKLNSIGEELLKVLVLLCEKSKEGEINVEHIYNLLTGHSRFMDILLSEESDLHILKENVICLLSALTKLNPTICKENHIGLLLSAYGATMSKSDQKLLYLLLLYANQNINMNDYCPFLWGKAAFQHYAIINTSHTTTWRQPRVTDVFSICLPEKIESTLLHFPVDVALEPSSSCVEVEEKLAHKIYDLRFFLPLIADFLSRGVFVPCNKLLESRILMLVLIALSNVNPETRALGYYCLYRFYSCLETSRFKDKELWLCLLDSLKNSIVSINPKVPHIMSLFLARTLDIFLRPDHKMYPSLYTFIMRKPVLQIQQVPEFYNLFYSSYIEHRLQRQWLLNLLAEGMRTTLDFHICVKRYVFPSLLTHYSASLSTKTEKISILKVVSNAVKMLTVAEKLCRDGLLVWLQNCVDQNDPCDDEILRGVREVLHNLEPNVSKTPSFHHVLDTLLKDIN